MRIVSKICLGILICSLLLISCGGVTPVPTITPTVVTTNTISVTNSPEPSLTPTYSLVEKIFVLPTEQFNWVNTPTPIATPDLNSSSASLKEISESDLLDLIDWLNQYSYQNFPPRMDWWSEGNFVGAQGPVSIAIEEYLYRYPESPNSERLKWQLAFINSITYTGLPGNQYGDAWMITELQRRLDQGETTPDRLEDILGQYWFDVAYFQPIENLFNDGKTGWLYQIVPQVWLDEEITKNRAYSFHGGLFVAVRETNEKEFQILLLNSAWNFSFSESSVFDISDHNQNGAPEIALYIGSHSGTMCGGNLLIYEWRNTSFAELTNENISIRDCGEDFEYSKLNNVPAIIYHGFFLSRTEQYVWNGESYEFAQSAGSTSFEMWRALIEKADFSYSDESELLKKVLASDEVTNFGPAFPDYLRYRLGIVNAFEARREEAISEFQDLMSSPVDETRKIFPDMAKKFLEFYKDDMSIYSACHQSNKVYDKALDPYRDSNGYVSSDIRPDILGLTFESYELYFPPLCDEGGAFALMVSLLPSNIDNLSAELRKNGVNIDYIKKVDANLDGKTEEWIVVFDTYDAFLIFSDGSHYQTKRLNASIEVNNTDISSFQVAVERLINFPDPVMIIQSNQDWTLLDVGENFESKRLFDDFGVANYVISNQDTMPQFQLFYTKPKNAYYPDHPWNGYRWDLSQNAFRDDLLEYNLFVLHDPEKSVAIVDHILPLLEEWKKVPDVSTWSLAYTYYISGLSYELSGNRQKAAQVYWQLWHDFPESTYAVLARYKLEP